MADETPQPEVKEEVVPVFIGKYSLTVRDSDGNLIAQKGPIQQTDKPSRLGGPKQ